MKVIGKIILGLILITNSVSVFSQETFDIEKYNLEKMKILNIIINSPQFDSIYYSKKVFFQENELLSEKTTIKLKKGKCKVKILKVIDPLRKSEYVVIGDFTSERINPTKARVQIENPIQKKLLNLGLEKINGEWKITNYIIMDN